MKFLLLLLALVKFSTSEIIVDDDVLLMQDFHDVVYESVRFRREANPQQQSRHQPQQQPQEPQFQYRPYSQVPGQIKELLKFQQARDPVINLPANSVPNLASSDQHSSKDIPEGQAIGVYRPNVQYGKAPQQPNYQNHAAAIAAQYRPQSQPQGHNQQYQPQGHNQQYQPQGHNQQYQPQGHNQQYQPQGRLQQYQPQGQPQQYQPQGQPQQYQPQGQRQQYQPQGQPQQYQRQGQPQQYQPQGQPQQYQPQRQIQQYQPQSQGQPQYNPQYRSQG